MVEALKERKAVLEERLREKIEALKKLCIKEAVRTSYAGLVFLLPLSVTETDRCGEKWVLNFIIKTSYEEKKWLLIEMFSQNVCMQIACNMVLQESLLSMALLGSVTPCPVRALFVTLMRFYIFLWKITKPSPQPKGKECQLILLLKLPSNLSCLITKPSV